MALRCNEHFAYNLPDGTPRVLSVGQLVQANDPAVKKFPAMFSDADEYLAADRYRAVEQATAAPGEKRAARKATADKADAPKAEA